ncbi:hypothetical protein EV421DRAFT_1842994 [Armillaria borealis]|uniref:Secreted protein n=1 Tax=Armillaria borealis TaxID=47425 RepID=A0AA39MHA8_9AGAR|nr:hypothetical protein EV421DRAFT_1842994 [Armillaria borealis]
MTSGAVVLMLCCIRILSEATSLSAGIWFRLSSFLTLYQIDSHSLGRMEQRSKILSTLGRYDCTLWIIIKRG